MRILLFGGAFNPPHFGHLLIIQQAFEFVPNFDQLWLLPSYSHSFGKQMIAPNHRLSMATLLIKSLNPIYQQKTRICPIEIDYQTNGETYSTYRLLNSETDYLQKTMFPQSTFPKSLEYSFLMGSDQLNSFTKWGNYEKLLESMHFYVYPRPNFPLQPLFTNMTGLSNPDQIITNLSSTILRHRLNNNQSLNLLTSAKIIAYIQKNKLYQT